MTAGVRSTKRLQWDRLLARNSPTRSLNWRQRSPHELLSCLLAVENQFGRERHIEWGPRTLDLDLLFFGDEVINDPPVLQVPHSGCWYRRFVLDPLFELLPTFVHPEKRQTIAELRDRLLVRPFRVEILDLARSVDPVLRSLQTQFPESELRAIRQPDEISHDDQGLFVRLDSGPLPPWVAVEDPSRLARRQYPDG